MIITLKKQPNKPKLYTWAEIKARPGIYRTEESLPLTVITFLNDKPFQLMIRSNNEVVLCSEPKPGEGWDTCKFEEIEAELTISNFVRNI